MSKIKSNFRIPYDNGAEAEMRLYNTVIRYGGKAVLVTGTAVIGENKFSLNLRGVDGRAFQAIYPDDMEIDLSPLPPIYTNFGEWAGKAYRIYRKAARKYQQGGNSGNTSYTSVGYLGNGMPCSPRTILDGYGRKQPSVTLAKAHERHGFVAGGFHSYALSEHVAIYSEINPGSFAHTGRICVEYHGETIGVLEIVENGVGMVTTENESLSLNPWCIERLNNVGIFVR